MDWITLAQLIIRLGIDGAERIYQNWQNKQEVTQADIDALRALGRTTPADLVLKGASALGLDATDPRVQAILTLAGAPTPLPPAGPAKP